MFFGTSSKTTITPTDNILKTDTVRCGVKIALLNNIYGWSNSAPPVFRFDGLEFFVKLFPLPNPGPAELIKQGATWDLSQLTFFRLHINPISIKWDKLHSPRDLKMFLRASDLLFPGKCTQKRPDEILVNEAESK